MSIEYLENLANKKYNANQDIYEDLENLDDASRILPKNILVYDIDNQHDAEKMIKVLEELNVITQIVTTNRGKHFYFAKSIYPTNLKVGRGVTYVGIETEIKKDKIVVKQNGKLRETINPEIFAPLPLFLCIPQSKKNQLESLTTLDVGDRNNKLFQHNVKCSANINLKPQIHELFDIINKCVLDVPMDKQEIKSVGRELEINSKENLTTEQIIDLLSCKVYNGELYITQEDGTYTNNKKFIKCKLGELTNVNLTSFAEVTQKMYNGLMLLSPEIKQDTEPCKIFNNGYVNKDFEFVEGLCPHVTPYRFDIDYDPNITQYEPIDLLLQNISGGDADYLELLKCVIATPFITNTNFKARHAKCYFLFGDGSNGKSTFTNMLNSFYKYCSAVPLRQLDNINSKTNMLNQLINFCNDEADNCLTPTVTQSLKTIVTAESCQIKFLYQDPVTAVVSPCIIGTTNNKLKAKESNNGINRRMQWLPVDYVVTEEQKIARPNYQMELETITAHSYLLNIVLEYAVKLNNGYQPVIPTCIADFTHDFREDGNHFITFLKDYMFNSMHTNGFDLEIYQTYDKTPIKTLMDAYDVWQVNNAISYKVGTTKRQQALVAMGYTITSVRLGDKSVVKGIRFTPSLYTKNKDYIAKSFEEYQKT